MNAKKILEAHFQCTFPTYAMHILGQEDTAQIIHRIEEDPRLQKLIARQLLTEHQVQQLVRKELLPFSLHHHMQHLSKAGLQPVFIIEYPHKHCLLFDPGDVTQALQRVKEYEQENFSGLLRTNEAMQYLEEKLHKRITKDTFYHMVNRLEARPLYDPRHIAIYRRHEGSLVTYYFSKTDLHKIMLTRRATPRRPKNFTPRHIQSAKELIALEKKYGRLLTDDQMLEAMNKRADYSYSYAAFCRRKYRGDIWPVAYMGKIALYAERQLDTLIFIPSIGRNRTKNKKASHKAQDTENETVSLVG